MPSFHATVLMTEWLVKTGKKEVLDQLASIPLEERKTNEKIKRIVQTMYNVWKISNKKIERLAVLGWDEAEMIAHFCAMLDNLQQIRSEYEHMSRMHGIPNAVADRDIKKYERAVKRVTNFSKSSQQE